MPRPLKREAEKVGHYQPVNGPARRGTMHPVTLDELTAEERDTWHPWALELFDAMKNSGTADFFQDSDWVAIKMMSHEYNIYLENPMARGNATRMENIIQLMSSLGVTEGQRRSQLRLELEPESEDDGESAGRKRRRQKQAEAKAAVVDIDNFR